jgi:hypothetical protein
MLIPFLVSSMSSPEIATEVDGASKKLLHGFRLGYMFVLELDEPNAEGAPSIADKYGIKSPHFFLIGYEVTWRMAGFSWLNVLLVANVTIAGLEQSKFFPGGNAVIGFELAEAFQIGVGVNAMPTKDKPAHMLVAAGWTPEIGSFYVPLHAFFMPDVDGQHRMGLTVGVNW